MRQRLSMPSTPETITTFTTEITLAWLLGIFIAEKALPNPALNPVRFALWTLRDKAAQRRLALR
jgi:hypothetical protein